jgi:FtsH-binding integral membrane protein
MRAVRYLYVLALALWLGGMALAGFVVAPTVFSVLQAWNASTGRMLAGDLFGEILRRLYLVGGVAAAVMFLALTIQRVLGPRPKAYGVRAGLIVLMFAVTAYAGYIIQPRIEALQQQVGKPMIELPSDDVRRTEFDGLHSLSTTLLSLTMVGGLALIAWETRE